VALRLGKYFGMTPPFWMNPQTDYDLRRSAARAPLSKINPRSALLDNTRPGVHARAPVLGTNFDTCGFLPYQDQIAVQVARVLGLRSKVMLESPGDGRIRYG